MQNPIFYICWCSIKQTNYNFKYIHVSVFYRQQYNTCKRTLRIFPFSAILSVISKTFINVTTHKHHQ